ncbi:ABC-three component system protein [Peribacillus sp. NPDC096622]|uniref:ABC-three component system protein n=1 Tax=Peribacillus sp. NPDC096622 TaxID=3364396 RepID=UPI003823C4CD
MDVVEPLIETVTDSKDIDKASSTWSGFLYQGKVAIYTVLKYINQYYPDLNEIKRYKLEIEYLEDFAILKDNQHFSLHQVKAKPTTNTIGSYNEANLNLLGKLGIYETVQEASLHTAVEIKKFTKENLFDNLTGFNVEGKKSQLATYKKLVFQDEKFNGLYNKLKISCKDGIVPIERVIELKKIKDYIISEIETFYSKCHDEKLRMKNSTIENKNYIYSNFINMIENMIHKDHLKELKENKIIIDFERFINILEDQNVFILTNNTVSGLLLHMISEDFHQYCRYYKISDDDMDTRDVWSKHLHHLKLFQPNEFFLLCRKLTPHLVLQNKGSLSIEEFRKIMQPSGVCDSFLHGVIQLSRILKDPIQADSAYVIQDRGTCYVLSTINDNAPYAFEVIGEDIYENLSQDDDMFKMLFEMDAYINSGIHDKEFTGNITMVHSDVEAEVITEEDLKQTITNQKTIRFVQVDSISEELLR